MASLVGDGAIGRSSEVCVGDEPRPQAVGAVGLRLKIGLSDRLLMSWLIDSGLSAALPARLPLVTRRKTGPSVMAASSSHRSSTCTGQRSWLPALRCSVPDSPPRSHSDAATPSSVIDGRGSC